MTTPHNHEAKIVGQKVVGRIMRVAAIIDSQLRSEEFDVPGLTKGPGGLDAGLAGALKYMSEKYCACADKDYKIPEVQFIPPKVTERMGLAKRTKLAWRVLRGKT